MMDRTQAFEVEMYIRLKALGIPNKKAAQIIDGAKRLFVPDNFDASHRKIFISPQLWAYWAGKYGCSERA